MSKCISRHGEYGEHTYPNVDVFDAERFVCTLCTVNALGERVRELEAERNMAYPAKFRFGAAENYVLGVHDTRRAIREALDQGDRA